MKNKQHIPKHIFVKPTPCSIDLKVLKKIMNKYGSSVSILGKKVYRCVSD